MYGEVKLETPRGEELTVPMLANAATLIRFNQIFHLDLLTSVLNEKTGNFDIDVISKLAFVMAKQAAKADMNTVNEDQYIEWLEDFDSTAFINNVNEIFNIYMKSKKNTSNAKK